MLLSQAPEASARKDLLIRVLTGPVSPVWSGSSVVTVDHRKDVQDFLASRRARLTPEQVGLPSYGGRRRVPGLRREEVAMLAGVSVDYYARLERGNLAGASESVLEAVARALQLDEAERQHLLDLARNSDTTPPPQAACPSRRLRPRPAVLTILAGMADVPAYVRTPRMDILAANPLCQAFYGGALDQSEAAAEPGPVRVPRSPLARVLPGLGHRRRRPGRCVARAGRS